MPHWSIPIRDGGTMSAYVAMPATLPAPAILAIQEIFGVNEEMRDRCDDYARQGYIAVCPDLFWRLEPNVDLTDKTQEEWDKALDLMRRFNVDQGVRDLSDALAFTRQQSDCSGFVADIGFCLGGKMAYLMASRTDADASVSYYGVGLEELLPEMATMRKPTLLHIADLDAFSTPDARDAVVNAAQAHPTIEVHVYEGCNHAFARTGGTHYVPEAAEAANARTLAFIKKARTGKE